MQASALPPGRTDVLIRIARYELEAWYFGDLDAVQEVYPRFKALQYAGKAKYRDPGTIVDPSN
jgi:hypothetical protein